MEGVWLTAMCYHIQAAAVNSSSSPSNSQSVGGAGGKPATAGGQSGTATTPTSAPGQQGAGHQPVEFNHAINYVNKIKVRHWAF